MSGRISSRRPRTRMYDVNYSIGESYYKGAIDRLDRKYGGRAATPPRQSPSLPKEVLERHEKAFADEDLSSARRRAEKLISENNVFDSKRTERPRSMMLNSETDFDEEISTALKKFRDNNKKVANMIDDVDLETATNNISTRRMVNRSEKMLDSVGISEQTRHVSEDSSIGKRRALKMVSDDSSDKHLTKWSALLNDSDTTGSAAAFRAKQSKARLNDLEDEMEALELRKAARERRAASLRAFVAENTEDSQAIQSQLKSSRVTVRAEKRAVKF